MDVLPDDRVVFSTVPDDLFGYYPPGYCPWDDPNYPDCGAPEPESRILIKDLTTGDTHELVVESSNDSWWSPPLFRVSASPDGGTLAIYDGEDLYRVPLAVWCVDRPCEIDCQNGGECWTRDSTPVCACPAGFTGQMCEINIDDCADNRCLNGSACVDGVDEYSCDCAHGTVGEFCECSSVAEAMPLSDLEVHASLPEMWLRGMVVTNQHDTFFLESWDDGVAAQAPSDRLHLVDAQGTWSEIEASLPWQPLGSMQGEIAAPTDDAETVYVGQRWASTHGAFTFRLDIVRVNTTTGEVFDEFHIDSNSLSGLARYDGQLFFSNDLGTIHQVTGAGQFEVYSDYTSYSNHAEVYSLTEFEFGTDGSVYVGAGSKLLRSPDGINWRVVWQDRQNDRTGWGRTRTIRSLARLPEDRILFLWTETDPHTNESYGQVELYDAIRDITRPLVTHIDSIYARAAASPDGDVVMIYDGASLRRLALAVDEYSCLVPSAQQAAH